MNTTIEALKNLYVARGGELTDSYDDIAGGAQVGNYTVIPDCVSALSKVGGSSDTYETVAEIAVGEMIEHEGLYFAQTDIPFPTVNESETFYLDTTDYPNDGFVTNEGVVDGILWNCTVGEELPVRINPNKPYVVFSDSDGTAVLISDTNDLENKTVTILKKVSAPSGDSDRLVVTLEYVEYDDGGQTRHKWQSDKSYTEIKAALNAKKDVEVLYPYDFDGVLTKPMLVHLFPFGCLDVTGTIAFNSMPYDRGDGVPAYLVAACLWDPGHDETGWEFQWYKIVQPAEFEFSVASDGQGGKTVTPAAGVTFDAVREAWNKDKNIVFKLTEGYDVTKFHVKSFVQSSTPRYFDCTELAYLGASGWAGVFLTFDATDTATMTIQPLAAQT